MKNEELPNELVWDEARHLSEVARTALADGQDDILPEDATLHLASCEACGVAMGQAALLSSRIGGLLSASERVASRPRLPIPAVAAALFLAALGTLPSVVSLPVWISQGSFFFTRTFPLFFRSVLALARGGASLAPALSGIFAALLLLAGIAIARSVPRPSNTASNSGAPT